MFDAQVDDQSVLLTLMAEDCLWKDLQHRCLAADVDAGIRANTVSLRDFLGRT